MWLKTRPATDEDTSINILAGAGLVFNDTDSDTSDVLTVASTDTTGTLGTVSVNADGSFTYDPNGQFESLAVGEIVMDMFLYIVSDGNGGMDIVTVMIMINGVNDAPIASDDLGPSPSSVAANDATPLVTST